jgi:2-dehydropantoate 2-reductase
MRIAVIGAGSIGSLYGANLARVGASVVLIDTWREHMERIRAAGLKMEGLHGAFTAAVEATVDPATIAGVDMALVAVGTYASREAAETARMVLAPEGFALTLQNGVGNVEVLLEALGPGRVLAGLSFHSADVLEPGRVEHTNKGPTYLGELDRSRSPRLAALAELLERAQMNPVLPEDINITLWSKFVHNCGINALCALTDLRPNELHEIPEIDAYQARIIREAMALVQARGIRLPDPDPVATIKDYCAHKGHRVSMAQHLARGRRTEIDALNGYVAEESRRLGLAAPHSEALTALIKGREHVGRVRNG